ncbi:hypothetical protein GALL_187550 [mine drainage metagenome]|uniref:DUF3391 domain-containing protein n=1 Tax=mine drainage metagenome TaxID=410659 RepID=A0A1J5SG72_9ZZZZ
MIKRIRREQLKPGMFIHDLNCSWIAHPFLLEDEKTIAEMAGYGIRELFIDTGNGLDVEGAQTKEEFDREIHDRFTRHTESIPGRFGERVVVESDGADLLHHIDPYAYLPLQ